MYPPDWGLPGSAPPCLASAMSGGTRRTAIQTQRTTAPMTKPTDQSLRRGLSRRQILKASAGTAALLAAAKLNFPARAFAHGAGPEVTAAKLRLIALTDASPLVVAKENAILPKY